MSKKVLLISSSPRRNGNSDILCAQFMQGAIEAGHTAEKNFCGTKRLPIVLVAVCAIPRICALSKMTWRMFYKKWWMRM